MKHYTSKIPTDLRRPRPVDERPGNPEIMLALQRALSARSYT
ncbi:hypothetical protein [Streptosporangium oxazolinicum]